MFLYPLDTERIFLFLNAYLRCQSPKLSSELQVHKRDVYFIIYRAKILTVSCPFGGGREKESKSSCMFLNFSKPKLQLFAEQMPGQLIERNWIVL